MVPIGASTVVVNKDGRGVVDGKLVGSGICVGRMLGACVELIMVVVAGIVTVCVKLQAAKRKMNTSNRTLSIFRMKEQSIRSNMAKLF